MVIGDAVVARRSMSVHIFEALTGDVIEVIDIDDIVTDFHVRPVRFGDEPALGIVTEETRPGVGVYEAEEASVATIYSVVTGEVLRTQEVPKQKEIILVDGIMVIGDNSGGIQGLDIETGESTWSLTENWYLEKHPEIGRTTFVAANTGHDPREAIFFAVDGSMMHAVPDRQHTTLIGEIGESDHYTLHSDNARLLFVSPEGSSTPIADHLANNGCRAHPSENLDIDSGILIAFDCYQLADDENVDGFKFIAGFDTESGALVWRIDKATMVEPRVQGAFAVGETSNGCAIIHIPTGNQVWVNPSPCNELSESHDRSRGYRTDAGSDDLVIAITASNDNSLRVFKQGPDQPIFFANGQFITLNRPK